MLTAPDGLKQIWFSAHYQSQYFPLVYTTFRFERALWGLNPKAAVEGSPAGTQDSLSEPFPRIDRRLERQQPQELPLGFQLRRS